jgi:hypothetical protein
MSDKDALYAQWLDHVFNRPVGDPACYFDWQNEEFHASREDLVYLIGRTCERSGTDLIKYSDGQVSNGIRYMFFNGPSDGIYALVQKGVAEDARIEAVRKMKNLYRDCFAKRCSPILCHLNEANQSPLNSVCYLLWDESPLGRWKDVVLEVMEFALYLPNYACIESALHGLGHRHHQSPERVDEIIDKYLSKTKSLKSELRRFAARAKTGAII